MKTVSMCANIILQTMRKISQIFYRKSVDRLFIFALSIYNYRARHPHPSGPDNYLRLLASLLITPIQGMITELPSASLHQLFNPVGLFSPIIPSYQYVLSGTMFNIIAISDNAPHCTHLSVIITASCPHKRCPEKSAVFIII